MKTPWYVFEIAEHNTCYLNDSQGNEIASCCADDVENKDQLKWICACVNTIAEAGINPEAVPRMVNVLIDISRGYFDDEIYPGALKELKPEVDATLALARKGEGE